MWESIKRFLVQRIFDLHGIKFDENGFTFNLHKDHQDAPLSPNYLDLRVVFRNLQVRKMIAGLMTPIVLSLKPDRLIDLPESATPLITTLSDMTGIEMVSIRSEVLKGGAKDHGVKSPINGGFEEGMTGLLIDDVVSSFAFTKFKAIPIIRDAGIRLLPKVIVVIDREEGGAEKLALEGFALISLLGLHTDITPYFAETGLVSDKIIRMSREFAEAAMAYALAS
jgi:orotate phosphoribosyltransferase